MFAAVRTCAEHDSRSVRLDHRSFDVQTMLRPPRFAA